MGEYSVGVATRAKIYETARSLFYEKGVSATSYKDIGERAGVNKGLIPYYFSSKGKLAELVLTELVDNMVAAVVGHWRDDCEDEVVLDTLVELMQFRMFTEDECVCRFYDEILSDPISYESATFNLQVDVMRRYARGGGSTISDEQLHTVAAMVRGTERELVHLVRVGALGERVEDMVRRDMLCCLYLVNADEEHVVRAVERAFEIAGSCSMKCDETFSCNIVER